MITIIGLIYLKFLSFFLVYMKMYKLDIQWWIKSDLIWIDKFEL